METFDQIDLIEPLRRALADQQYTIPTPVQQQAIPPALEGRDILGSAQTGTGKTAAFALPILQRLGKRNRKAIPNRPFALILAPTRELAIQISESLDTYGKHMRLRQSLVFGGVSQNRQVSNLRRGSHILVATPGRLLDLMNQGFVDLSRLEIFVLDEADRMLDMGFLPDLKRIIKCLPAKRQSLFFSATLPAKIVELSNSLLIDPVRVSITPKRKSVDAIQQQVLYVERAGKQSALKNILKDDCVDRTIVFTRTKRGANTLADKLERDGVRAVAIHGNKSQNARQRALEAFRDNKVRVLVATDVAARGIDVDGVSHVINYDVPDEPDSYIHRIGRTGRAGADGIAVIFCSQSERRELLAIEKVLGKRIPLAPNQPDPPSETTEDGRPKPNRFRRQRPTDGGGGRPGSRTRGGRTNARTPSSSKSKNDRGGRRRPGTKSESDSTARATSKPTTQTNSAKTNKAGSLGDPSPTASSTPKPKPKKKQRKGKYARLRGKPTSSVRED